MTSLYLTLIVGIFIIPVYFLPLCRIKLRELNLIPIKFYTPEVNIRKILGNNKKIFLAFIIGLSLITQHSFAQTTIVNYNFNSGNSFAALAPTLATNITSTPTGTAFASSATGVATGASAFTANATAGNYLSGAANSNWTFTLGGSHLQYYNTFKVYFQAQRTSGSSNILTVAYNANNAGFTSTGITASGVLTISATNTWYEGLFTLPVGADNPTSLAIRLTVGGNSTVRIDNFEVQAEPSVQVSDFSGNTICSGSTGQLTTTISGGTSPYTVVYNDGTANRTATGVVSGTAFNVFTNPSATNTYTLVSVTDANSLARTVGFTDATATITVNQSPAGTATVSPTSICLGSSASLSSTVVGYTNTIAYPVTPSTTAIPNSSQSGLLSTVSVSGLPTSIALLTGITVKVNLSHGTTSEVELYLIRPGGAISGSPNGTYFNTTTSGQSIALSADQGGTGNDYTNTIFSDLGTNTIAAAGAAAPFTGTYKPEEAFSTLTGDPNGTWTLKAVDDAGATTGTLNDWTITFSYNNGVNYSWSSSTGLFTSTIQNPGTISPSPLVTTDYYLQATDQVNGCITNKTVTVSVSQTPTTANAGPDQTGAATCGLTQVTLAANVPTNGTGAWSIVSGTGGSLGTATNPASTFSGTAGNSYTLRWTVSNSPCTASTDDVVITFTKAPTGVLASATSTLICNGGSSSLSSTGTSSISNSASYPVTPSTTAIPNNSSTGLISTVAVSGLPTSISSLTNISVTVNVAHTNDADLELYLIRPGGTLTNTANGAYINTIVAGQSIALTADQGGSGDNYTNTIFSDAGTNTIPGAGAASPFTNTYKPEQAFSTLTGDPNGTWTLKAFDDATGGGSNATGTLTNWTIAFTYLNGVTYTWSSSTGLFTSSVQNPGAVSPLVTTDYTVAVTDLGNGCVTSNTVTVNVSQPPTTADAGVDQTDAATCGLTQVTLAANAPTVGTGVWSYVGSSTGGTIITPSSPTSTFSGTAGSTYTLRWTISNNPCTASTDDVVIKFNKNPTANAGADQIGTSTCGLTQVTLAATTPPVGTGAWSVISGDVNYTFSSLTSPTATFSGTAGVAYTLRWTVTNNPCGDATDDVDVLFNIAPTTAAAGPDQTGSATCNLTQVTLSANAPSVGTGAWTYVGSSVGGSIANSSDPVSTFNGTAGSTYTLRWTTTNGICTSTDDVVITFNRLPSASDAGPDQTGLSTCGLTQVTLAANAPSIGTGAWSFVGSSTGGTITTPSSRTSTFTGTAGSTYTLRWTITSGPCTVSTDDVVIKFNRNPTTANAGPDQTGSTTCGLTQVTLAATTPTFGTGAWSYVGSSTGGTITTPSSATSTFSGTAGSTYTLRWTVSNSPCTVTASDDVVITFNTLPIATITSNYCMNGGGVELTASTGTSYLWSDGTTTKKDTVDLAGDYSVQITNAAGCVNTAYATVAQELVVNGNFNAGNTGFTSSYTNKQAFLATDGIGLVPEGYYAVNTDATKYHTNFFGMERVNPGTGNIMIVNGFPNVAGVKVWQETVTIQPNTTYYFSAWALAMNTASVQAQLQFAVNDSTIGTTAVLASNTRTTAPFGWTRFYGTWNSGPTATTADISIVDKQTAAGGNDFAIDDISCSTLSPVTFTLNPSGGGAPLCSGNTLNLTSGLTGGTSPFTYSWTGPVGSGFTSTTANPIITNVTTAYSGTYSLNLVDGYGCTTNATTSVTVNATPNDKVISAVASTICYNTGTNIQVAATQSTVKYQLRNDADNSNVGASVTGGSGTTINLPTGNLTGTTTFNVLATTTSTSCTLQLGNTVTVTVSPTTVGGTLSPASTTVCTGINSTTITLSGYTGAIVRWESATNNTFTTGLTSIANTTTILTATDLSTQLYYRAVIQSSPCAIAYSSTAIIAISAVSVGGTVTPASTTVCIGTNSTALTLGGKTGNVIRWESSTDNFVSVVTSISNVTTSLTATNLYVQTSYRAVVQSSPCSLAYSSVATISISPVTVGGTLSPATPTVCTGTNSTTITLSGYTGNVIRWESATNNTFTTGLATIANTTNTLTATNLSAQIYYRAVVQSSPCTLAYSSTTSISISQLSVGGTVSGSATVCTGTNSTALSLTGKTGNVIRWESSTDNFASVVTSISNVTTSLTATNLTATTSYRAVVQSGVCSIAYSSVATITVSELSVGGTLSPSSTTVCTGANSTTLTLSGNTGNVIRWESATNNTFTTGLTSITNTTNTLTATNLIAQIYYRVVVQSSPCTLAYSSTASISISQLSVGGTVSGGGLTVCTGANSTNLSLAGNTGNVIRWESSTDNFASVVTSISNTTTSLTAANLTAQTSYRAVVQSSPCSIAYSSVAVIAVSATTVGGSITGSTTVCTGANSTILTLSGYTGSILRWESSTDNFASVITSIANTTTALTATNLSVQMNYRAVIQSGACSVGYSSVATIAISPLTVGGTITGGATVCSGSNSTTLTLTGSVGSITRWESSTDNFASVITPIANTTNSLNINNSSVTTAYRVVVQSGVCSVAYSSVDIINVNSTGTWLGVNVNWHDNQNWCGGVPDINTDVLIPNTVTHYPVLIGGTGTVHDITLQSGASLTVNSKLQIAGAVTSNSIGTIDATGGTIEMQGAVAQTIAGSMFYKKTVDKLVISNTHTNGVTAANLIANDTLRITDAISFGNVDNAVLNSTDNIVLVSTVNKTARVADITNDLANSNNNIIGKVIVERFLPMQYSSVSRRWRLLTAPIKSTGAPTLNAAWQEGVVNSSVGSPINPRPGYGTQLTNGNTSAAVANGFDMGSTNSPSIYYLNPGPAANWLVPANTAVPFTNQEGYMVFVRGDRSIIISNQYVSANPTTLEVKGNLNIGDVTKNLVLGKQVIGNPYASAIRFDDVACDGHTFSDSGYSFYHWDPKTSGSFNVGRFVTVSNDGVGKPSSYTVTANQSGISDGRIESGAAVIVISSGNTNSITFHETDKITQSSTIGIASRPTAGPNDLSKLYSNLYAVSGDGTEMVADGVANTYYPTYHNAVDEYDAPELISFNSKENLSIARDGKLLSIEKRKQLVAKDTIFLEMRSMSNYKYRFEFVPKNFPSGLQGYLIDTYTATETPINLQMQLPVSYIFTVDNNIPASANIARFHIVFRPYAEAGSLPVTIVSVKAIQKNTDIVVDWSVANELNMQKYIIEKSTDGIHFTSMATVNAIAANNYEGLDKTPANGVNYYRINSIDKDGTAKYSQVVKVVYAGQNPSVSIYPTIVTNNAVEVSLTDMPKGKYAIRLLNAIGQLIANKNIDHAGGSNSVHFVIDKTLANGVYQIEVITPDNERKPFKIVKQ